MPLEPKLASCGWRCPHQAPRFDGATWSFVIILEVTCYFVNKNDKRFLNSGFLQVT